MHTPIELKTTHLERQDPAQVSVSYDRAIDTLFVDFAGYDGPRATYYLTHGVHYVYDPRTNEVVGYRVETWQQVFLTNKRDLWLPWLTYRLASFFARFYSRFQLFGGHKERILRAIRQYRINSSPL